MSGRHAEGEGEWCAAPAVYQGTEGRPGAVLFTIDVDGEQFEVREAADGGSAYGWLTGPNEGYGFATSGPAARSTEEHRQAIRGFLAMIDPATGFIA